MKSGIATGKILFSDEKMFNVEAVFNRQNDRILVKSSVDIPVSMRKVFRHQKPPSVMVWAAVSKIGKPPLIFVPHGSKVKTNSYIETILTPALAEAKKHFKSV